jgi:hypothetical protein
MTVMSAWDDSWGAVPRAGEQGAGVWVPTPGGSFQNQCPDCGSPWADLPLEWDGKPCANAGHRSEQGTESPPVTYVRTLNPETLPEIFEAVPGKCYWRGTPLEVTGYRVFTGKPGGEVARFGDVIQRDRRGRWSVRRADPEQNRNDAPQTEAETAPDQARRAPRPADS